LPNTSGKENKQDEKQTKREKYPDRLTGIGSRDYKGFAGMHAWRYCMGGTSSWLNAWVLLYTSQCSPVWYLNCLHHNSQGLGVAVHIIILSSFGTLTVHTTTPKAWELPYTS
jgi:hypothetical protein